MGLIQRKLLITRYHVIRSPLILMKKKDFIVQHKDEFQFIFVTDFNHRHVAKYGSLGNWSMKSRMTSWMGKCYGPKGLRMAERIREVFGYHDMTSVDTILFTWRRLYLKMYNLDWKGEAIK